LKTTVSCLHLDVLQRDISIDICNPMDVRLRYITRLKRWATYILWIEACYQGVFPRHSSTFKRTFTFWPYISPPPRFATSSINFPPPPNVLYFFFCHTFPPAPYFATSCNKFPPTFQLHNKNKQTQTLISHCFINSVNTKNTN
jgi:hypothetical protein